jgi:transcription elongation factor Elf1
VNHSSQPNQSNQPTIPTPKQLITCPHCGAGQGEIEGNKITYKRKGGAVTFKSCGGTKIKCYGCGLKFEVAYETMSRSLRRLFSENQEVV